MAHLPESLTELKEYCSNCGKVLGKGSGYVRATIEQISSKNASLLIDYDHRHFCKVCLRDGVYISVKNPDDCAP